MSRRVSLHRLFTVFMVVFAVLFAQMALASYVCPGMNNAEAMTDGAPCKCMDTALPVLCHQHAADASHSFEKVKPSQVPPPLQAGETDRGCHRQREVVAGNMR